TDLTRLGYDVLAFDPTGTRIVTLAAGRTIQVWDLDAAAPARPPIAAPRVDEIAGFDAEGHLVVLDRSDSDPTLITIDLDTGQEISSVTPRLRFARLTEDGRAAVLENLSGTERVEFPLDARAWADELCARLGRPYTPAEADRLPAGADRDPPCPDGGA